MPGVPSGRGCNGCRRMKKKCDQQQPACSRCVRLKIECVGGGQRRFKFVEPTIASSGSTSSEQSRSATPQDVVRKASSSEQSPSVTPTGAGRQASSSSLVLLPSNEVTLLVDAFTSTLDPSIDERYNLIGTYGPFLQYIPSHLGRNKALDAAVMVLMEAHSNICTRSGVTTSSLSKNGHALTQLRLALDDPETACSTETLCAAMILCICQSFLGGGNASGVGHVQGMARIMKHRGSIVCDRGDEFEQQLLATLRGPVVFEAFWTDAAGFTDQDWDALAENYKDPTGHPEHRIMLCAARVPMFLRRGNAMKKQGLPDPSLANDIASCYEMMRLSRSQMSATLDSLQQRFTDGEIAYSSYFTIHFAYIRLYTVAIGVISALGCILSVINEDYPGLRVELHDCAVEILDMAQRLAKYRPLGAGVVPMCLCTCWAATEDSQQRQHIEQTIRDYMDDFPGEISYTSLERLRELERRLKLRD